MTKSKKVNLGGRPSKKTPDEKKILAEKFNQYITNNDVPIIAEFCYQNDLLKTDMYDWPEFSKLLKKCVAKKEAQLEKGCLAGKLNASMAIFSLKQLGWSDKINHNVDDITIRVVRASELQIEGNNDRINNK